MVVVLSTSGVALLLLLTVALLWDDIIIKVAWVINVVH